MKKFLATVSIVAISSMSFAVAPAAADAGGNFPNQICTAHGDFGHSHGACVSWFEKGSVNFCKWLHDDMDPADYEFYFGGTGLGACVSWVKQIIN